MPSFVFESSSFYCTTGVNFLFLTSPIYMLTSNINEETENEKNQENEKDDNDQNYEIEVCNNGWIKK